jgi:glutaredoxin
VLVLRASVRAALWVVLLGSVIPFAGCRSKEKDAPSASTTLPDLIIQSDTPNMMLTWIDEHGGTHVETTSKSIPLTARKMVRVVIADQEAGTKDPIYIVDLSDESAPSYRAEQISRRQWEDEIERRRGQLDLADLDALEENGTTRRPPSHPPVPRDPGLPRDLPPSPFGPDPNVPDKPPIPGLVVIVYGADWCKPCHAALDHLKRRGVKTEFKDVDKDAGAKDDMQRKLAKLGKPSAAVPVIDVGGQILIGFSPSSLDKALDALAGGTML